MKIVRMAAAVLAAGAVAAGAFAQETSLTRAEVAAVKAKLVAVQQAMGADPQGYIKESESFNLPTDFRAARDGKYSPIGAGVSMRYTDRAVKEGSTNAEQAAKDLQAKYAAAITSGDPQAIAKMAEEATRISQLAMATSVAAQSAKPNLSADIRFNSGSYAGIDPDAVVFESSGVIALREKQLSSDEGRVTVYVDPVALKNAETLSKVELKTPDDGVSSKAGVFNVVIALSGRLADVEAWAKTFETAQILSLIDAQ